MGCSKLLLVVWFDADDRWRVHAVQLLRYPNDTSYWQFHISKLKASTTAHMELEMWVEWFGGGWLGDVLSRSHLCLTFLGASKF